jgi:hypothetical protein
MVDLEIASLLTWEDLNYFLFHRCTDFKGNLFGLEAYKEFGLVDSEFKRVKRLFEDAFQSGEISANDNDKEFSFEKTKFKRDIIFDWLQKNKIIERLYESGIKIDKSKYEVFKRLGATAKVEKTNLDFFPAPDGTKWERVKIKITSENQIIITISREVKTYTLEKFKTIFPNIQARECLFQIIQLGGTFDRAEMEKQGFRNIKHKVSILRKSLISLFEIQENPLPYNLKTKEYKTSFKVSVVR